MSSKQNQRFAGLLMTAMGVSLTIWNWYIALSYGRFFAKLTFLGSTLIIFGLSAILFPNRDNI